VRRPGSWLAVLVSFCLACGACAPIRPPIARVPFWKERPISESVAAAIKPGMASSEVLRLAGQAVGVGGVWPAGQEFGPDAYSVHCDTFATPDLANGTWIYWVASDTTGPSDEVSGHCLFIQMRDGIVVRTYEGQVGVWTM
jgi:hypothetical protein